MPFLGEPITIGYSARIRLTIAGWLAIPVPGIDVQQSCGMSVEEELSAYHRYELQHRYLGLARRRASSPRTQLN